MNIRAYKDKDYKEVKSILQGGKRFYDDWDKRAHWRVKIENDSNSILVAEEDGKVIGSILMIKDPWISFLYRLVVKKGYLV